MNSRAFAVRAAPSISSLAAPGLPNRAMLAAEFGRGARTVGVVVLHSRGEGDYRMPEASGEVEATLAGGWPWGRYELRERVSIWGLAGYGEGDLVLPPSGDEAMEAGIDLLAGSMGVRGKVLEGGENGFSLAVTSDALGVWTTSEARRVWSPRRRG